MGRVFHGLDDAVAAASRDFPVCADLGYGLMVATVDGGLGMPERAGEKRIGFDLNAMVHIGILQLMGLRLAKIAR